VLATQPEVLVLHHSFISKLNSVDVSSKVLMFVARTMPPETTLHSMFPVFVSWSLGKIIFIIAFSGIFVAVENFSVYGPFACTLSDFRLAVWTVITPGVAVTLAPVWFSHISFEPES